MRTAHRPPGRGASVDPLGRLGQHAHDEPARRPHDRPASDRPPRVSRTRRWAERARWGEPGRLNPVALRRFMRWFAPLLRLAHRPRMMGAEHLPRDRPFLLVANHSGGIALSEIACLMVMAQAHFPTLRVAGLAHPISFHLWPLPIAMRLVGAIPSSYEAAAGAFAQGVGVLVFPGGDHEVSRPMWQANRVDFNGRMGFLRVARAAGVPIVPMGIRGSYWTCPSLYRSTWLLPRLLVIPHLFGLKRYPLTLTGAAGVCAALALGVPVLGWPAALGVAWLWLASLFPLMPAFPATIRYRIGEPIAPETLFADDDLDAAYHLVQGRVQGLVDDSASG